MLTITYGRYASSATLYATFNEDGKGPLLKKNCIPIYGHRSNKARERVTVFEKYAVLVYDATYQVCLDICARAYAIWGVNGCMSCCSRDTRLRRYYVRHRRRIMSSMLSLYGRAK